MVLQPLFLPGFPLQERGRGETVPPTADPFPHIGEKEAKRKRKKKKKDHSAVGCPPGTPLALTVGSIMDQDRDEAQAFKDGVGLQVPA